MIGEEGNQLLFYSSPTASPVSLTDLFPVPKGWGLNTVSDINDAGDVVGAGVNPSGQFADYELIPNATPEPTTLALLCVGCLELA